MRADPSRVARTKGKIINQFRLAATRQRSALLHSAAASRLLNPVLLMPDASRCKIGVFAVVLEFPGRALSVQESINREEFLN